MNEEVKELKCIFTGGMDFHKRYKCDITRDLDIITGINNEYGHYIMIEYNKFNENTFAIRIIGSTVGYLTVDDENIITDIEIYTHLNIIKYPDGINNTIKSYIGYKLIFDKK